MCGLREKQRNQMRDLELKVKRVSVEITRMEFYALGVHACLIWCN